jgi:hypothetical protein
MVSTMAPEPELALLSIWQYRIVTWDNIRCAAMKGDGQYSVQNSERIVMSLQHLLLVRLGGTAWPALPALAD